MKKILLIILIVWNWNGFAQTKGYTPFPNEQVLLIMKRKGGLDIPTETTYFNKAILGDTIINNIKYMKYYDPTLKSALRNDTLNKKVYRHDFATAKDTLLYNFNLKVNDTVIRTKQYKIWVESIDSVLLLDKKYYNRYNFNRAKFTGMIPYPEYSPLIEGLGYEAGNKIKGEPGHNMITTYHLVCASANKKIQVSLHGVPPSGEYCGAIITNMEKTVNNEALYLFPNPTTGKFQLKTENLKIHTIEITNILGKTIYTANLKNEITEIDLSNQSTGVYFVRLQDEKGQFATRKIIKQ